MKKWLKWFLIATFIVAGVGEISAQKLRFPTNVRYIGGGYIAKRPYFPTLESALNDVKPYAAANNPYVFWIDSDSLQIADWDSVFTASGLTMKDSIDIYYVATGKIKWAGFGQGGGGGSGTTIPTPSDQTLHYDYPTWDPTAVPAWLDSLDQALDSIDQDIWYLIVYTDSVYLYIENDTLKFRSATIPGAHTRPDTTIILYGTENESITGDWDFTGKVALGVNGWLSLPAADYSGGNNALWRASNKLWFSNGVDTFQVATVKVDDGVLQVDSLITWQNLNDVVKDSINQQAWGCMYINEDDPDTITVASTGVDYTIGGTTSGGVLNKVTVSDSSLTVTEAGTYMIQASFSIDVSTNMTAEVHIHVNDIEIPRMGLIQDYIGTAGYQGVSLHGLIELSASDVIKIKVQSTSGTGTMYVGHLNLLTHRLSR